MGIEEQDEAFLRSLAGPQHWTEDDARRALTLWEASGESRARFAERYALRPTRLAWWAKRLDEWGSEELRATAERGAMLGRDAFVELLPKPVGTAATHVRIGGTIEVELSSLDAVAARFVVEVARLWEHDRCS